MTVAIPQLMENIQKSLYETVHLTVSVTGCLAAMRMRKQEAAREVEKKREHCHSRSAGLLVHAPLTCEIASDRLLVAFFIRVKGSGDG